MVSVMSVVRHRLRLFDALACALQIDAAVQCSAVQACARRGGSAPDRTGVCSAAPPPTTTTLFYRRNEAAGLRGP